MKVFVYGTLKSGYGNSRALLNNPHSHLVGRAITTESFFLADLGSFPGMLRDLPGKESGLKSKVKGELWEIDEEIIKPRLDRLEGAPSFYHEELIKVEAETKPDGDWTKEIALAYFLTDEERYMNCQIIANGEWGYARDR